MSRPTHARQGRNSGSQMPFDFFLLRTKKELQLSGLSCWRATTTTSGPKVVVTTTFGDEKDDV